MGAIAAEGNAVLVGIEKALVWHAYISPDNFTFGVFCDVPRQASLSQSAS